MLLLTPPNGNGRCVLAEKQKSFEEMSLEDHVEMYENQGFDHKEAMKKAAKDRGITKRDVYQHLLNIKK